MTVRIKGEKEGIMFLQQLGDFIERPAGQKIIWLAGMGVSIAMYKSGLDRLAENLFIACLTGLGISSRGASPLPSPPVIMQTTERPDSTTTTVKTGVTTAPPTSS